MSTRSPHSLLRAPRAGDAAPIVIGLVNNMPDAALRTTERQFRELLGAAANGRALSVRLFSLPGLPRGEAGQAHVSENYEDFGELWTSRLDGLIVTGSEPRAAALEDEPYWAVLAELVEWAQDHTVSTIWSCLAAHAAVLHLDGVGRRALGEKLSGVFECATAGDHPIVAGCPPRWTIPHSRYNELPEEALVADGYTILARSADAGADMFCKEGRSLFLFLQGHPEYDAGALLREYRRDVGRFLAGERERYPEMPRGYFDSDLAAAFAAFKERASQRAGADLLAGLPAVAEAKLTHSWRSVAVQLYANWLSYLAEQASAGRSRMPRRERVAG